MTCKIHVATAELAAGLSNGQSGIDDSIADLVRAVESHRAANVVLYDKDGLAPHGCALVRAMEQGKTDITEELESIVQAGNEARAKAS